MQISYSKIYHRCLQKCEERGISFDFGANEDLQHPESVDDIFKNLVYHSQNRSQGCAINFSKEQKNGDRAFAEHVWCVIANYQFNLADDFDYINLFLRFKNDQQIGSHFSVTKGKDIQYLQLAKTCQCIRRYLQPYNSNDGFRKFVNDHTFTNNAEQNWSILKQVSDSIYNVGTELVPDFFKEQECIKGRDFLIKADIHVKRFFSVLYGKKYMTDRQVYKAIMDLYNMADSDTQRSAPPYKVDKLIYRIGSSLGSPAAAEKFAESCK